MTPQPPPSPPAKRASPLQLLEDEIGRHLAQSAASGELRSAAQWGRPLELDDAYAQTPAELRMPMKILKDAGVPPPEVELMQRIAALQAQADVETRPDAAAALQRQVGELRLLLSLRLENLRGGSL